MTIEKMKCPECDAADLKEDKVPYTYKGTFFGWYTAEKCPNCGATYFSEESALLIEKRAKQLGVWEKG